eukprot:9468453-Pyramimonas_sp.AAC.1
MLTKQLTKSRIQMRLMKCQIKYMGKRIRDLRARMERIEEAAAQGIQHDDQNAAHGESAIQTVNDEVRAQWQAEVNAAAARR